MSHAKFMAIPVMLAAMTPLAAQSPDRSVQPIVGDPVTTESGRITGTQLPSGVRAYLGIPFAAPPTGDLRWRAPEPIKWSGIMPANRKGAACIQVLRPHDINHYFGEEATSEDCLTLNLWVPAAATPAAKLPVIVFIYGGGFTIGSSGMANYDGEGGGAGWRGVRQFQLPRRRVRIHGASCAQCRTGRAIGQLRPDGPDRRAEMGARKYRQVRRATPIVF